MRRFLFQRWFLLLILLGFTVAGVSPRWLHWTRSADPQIVMALALLLSSVTLQSRRLYQALTRPLPALWAAFISYGPLPALAWLLGSFLPLEDFRIGLMIAASVPCTLASAVLWTRLAGGDEAVALLSTMLTTGLSWLATTAWLALGTGRDVHLDTGPMMTSLAVVLVLPVGVAQLARGIPALANTVDRFKSPLSVVSRLLILLIMFRAAVDVGERLGSDDGTLGTAVLLGAAAACLGTHLLALAAGMASARLFGFDRASRIAIGFAGSQKTLPVSIYLFDQYFRAFPLAVIPLAFYHVGQLVLDTFIADLLRPGSQEKPADQTAEDGENSLPMP
jgi:sodium/bile acid cotransporter 7